MAHGYTRGVGYDLYFFIDRGKSFFERRFSKLYTVTWDVL